MENENLENVSVPETEQTPEAVVTEEIPAAAETVEAPVDTEKKANGNAITNALGKISDKGKELIDNPKPLLDKIKAVSLKTWIFIGAGITALIAVLLVIGMLSNTYKAPIRAAEKVLNSKSVNQVIKRAPAVLNGFGEKDAKELIAIAKKTDAYKDNIDDIEETFDSAIELLEDNAGRNYKIDLKVTDKEKLDKDEVKAFRNQLRTIGKMGSTLEDLDKDYIEDMSDELGISKSQVKKAIRIAEGFCKDCKDAKVKKGYELTVEVKITGRELDDPVELEIPVNVYKVDGRWVLDVFSLADGVEDAMGNMGNLLPLLGMGSSSYIPGF